MRDARNAPPLYAAAFLPLFGRSQPSLEHRKVGPDALEASGGLTESIRRAVTRPEPFRATTITTPHATKHHIAILTKNNNFTMFWSVYGDASPSGTPAASTYDTKPILTQTTNS
jgi:hypothetical protein